MNHRRPSLIGEASDPVSLADPPFVRAAAGHFASRTYRFFLRIRDVRSIPAYIPRIARALRADEDCVWDLFVQYFRGVDEPWRA